MPNPVPGPGVLTAADLLPPRPQVHLLLLAQLGIGLQVLAQELCVVKQGAQVVDAAPASPKGKPLEAAGAPLASPWDPHPRFAHSLLERGRGHHGVAG